MPESTLRKVAAEDYLTRVFAPTEPVEVAFIARRVVAKKVILEVWADAEMISVDYTEDGKSKRAIAERHHFVDPDDALFLVETADTMRRELAEMKRRRSLADDARRFAGQATDVKTGETKTVSDRARQVDTWPI